MSYGVGHRHCSDPALLWLWCWLAGAPAIPPLAWETLDATDAALKKKREKEKNPIENLEK